MLDSDFWRDLAEKFRAADPYQLLRADWHYSIKIGDEPPPFATWRLVGTDRNTRFVEREFRTLAERGGPKIYPHPQMDSLTGWLEALRSSRLNTENQTAGVESRSDGTPVAHIFFGSIVQVCEASAILCKDQESLALEIERMTRRQSEVHTQTKQRRAYQAALDENGAKPEAPLEADSDHGLSSPDIQSGTSERPDCKASRRALVEAFLQQCNEQSSTRIRRRHIWLSVGHSKGRQFEYWQGCDPKATAEDERNFGRILRTKPAEFVAILRQKRLLK